MRRHMLAAVAAVLMVAGSALAGPVPSAHAAEALDQAQTDRSGGATPMGWGDTRVLAQTFTAGVSGTLTRVELEVQRGADTTQPLNVQIRTGVTGGTPRDAVLKTVSVPADRMPPDTPTWVSIDLPGGVPVTAGSTYAIVPYVSYAPGAGYYWFSSSLAQYEQGGRWFTSDLGFPLWAGLTGDFTFKTYVDDGQQPHYDLSAGFAAPVDMSTPARRVWNTVKGGRTVPLKFEVFDAATGSEVTDVAVVGSFTTTRVACDSGTANEDPVELVTTGGTALRYDEASGQFVQSWRTPTTAGSCYQVTVTLVDGSVIDQAFFEIK